MMMMRKERLFLCSSDVGWQQRRCASSFRPRLPGRQASYFEMNWPWIRALLAGTGVLSLVGGVSFFFFEPFTVSEMKKIKSVTKLAVKRESSLPIHHETVIIKTSRRSP